MKAFPRSAGKMIQKYYPFIFVVILVCFFGAVAAYKVFVSKPTYVYAEVKVGQGLWWASTQRPSLWFVKAILNADSEKDYLGKEVATILSAKYYPWGGTSQYDVYLNMRLKVSKLGNSGKYSFKRATIGVGAPADFEFSNVQFSGTIMELSDKPFSDQNYVEKTVTLTKREAYPWEYEQIPVGDTYFNGTTNTITVLSKDDTDTSIISPDMYGNTTAATVIPTKYVTVVMKMKGVMINGRFVYGEDTTLVPGKETVITSGNFVFNNYSVAKVE